MSARLSIIVPVYNQADDSKLTFCMDSLVNQTIKDYEIIAVDDCSTDDSLEILRSYEKKYPDKVRVIACEENRRQGGAKNLGLRATEAEWIGFIDSDDWITPDYYEKLLKKADETGADVVGCKYSLVYEHTFEKGEELPNCFDKLTGILDYDKHAGFVLNSGSMVLKIYKRSLFYDNGLWFPEGIFYEDNCLSPLVMLHATHFEYIDEANYYYYQQKTSTVHTVSPARCYDRIDAMTYFIEECFKREFLNEYPDEIEELYTEMMYVNTLFSYMLGVKWYKRKLSFLKMLRDGIIECFPEYDTNPYFYEKYDEEVKRMTEMHCRSPFKFMIYFTVKDTYRRIRKIGPYKKDNNE